MLCSVLVATAFAVMAVASPINIDQRNLVVVTDVVTDAVVVTETVGVVPAAPISSAPAQNDWPYESYGHNVPGSTTTGSGSGAPQVFSEARVTPSAPVAAASGIYVAPPPVTSSISGSTAGPTPFVGMVLDHHNAHRANHSASNLIWDPDLANTAAKIAASCYYAHNIAIDGGGYGQNIAAGAPATNISSVITDTFYNGEINWFDGLYGEATPDMTNFEHWGHFSQIVWKATSSVGCAVQDCTGQGLGNAGADVAPFFTVCNYKGGANVGGVYGDNIGQPLGHVSIQYDTFGFL